MFQSNISLSSLESSSRDVNVNEDLSAWTRKPPFHLPPLDPSVFEKKRKKKKERRNIRQTTVASAADQQENSEGRGTKYEENLDSATGGIDEGEENASYPNKNSLFVKTAVPPGRRKLPPTNQSVKHENGDLESYQETPRKQPVKDNSKYVARACNVRPSSGFRPIASSVEVLPSKKAITNAGSSKSHISPSTEVLPQENVTDAASSNRFYTEKSNERRIGNRPGFYGVRQQAAQFEQNECFLLGQVRRSSSQSVLRQSRNGQAASRGRRVGVCKEAESTAAMNNRMQTRVLMKKFGTLDISH